VRCGAISENLNLLRESSENYGLASLDLAVVEALEQVSRSLVPDMPDRIIAATVLSLGLPLLSCDWALDKLRSGQAWEPPLLGKTTLR
jgi:predicted nucleic acid-binding protein